jgi:hypothetical protein
MHCPRACSVLAQEPKSPWLALHHQDSQDFLYRPKLQPFPGREGKRKQNTSTCSTHQTLPRKGREAKTKYIHMFYASNSWASWKSHDICMMYMERLSCILQGGCSGRNLVLLLKKYICYYTKEQPEKPIPSNARHGDPSYSANPISAH